MIGANPLSAPFKVLLDAIGAVLAFLYRYIPNYGVDIILLTLAIRILLLPLGIKQIRSMQAMQSIQPKVREIQRKYKGKRDAVSRQKMNEETMRLYRERGVNPFSGCLPILAQFPILIALFGVLNVPNGLPHVRGAPPQAPPAAYTQLYRDLTHRDQAPGIRFLGANLVCSAREAGTGTTTVPKKGTIPQVEKDCGKGSPVKIPFYLFLVAMIGTTYYQQRQMQRASPAQSQQQQMLTRIMPLFFGVIGFGFPAGLVLYWTTTNLVQIGQQFYMLPQMSAGREEPPRSRSQRDDGGSGTGPSPKREVEGPPRRGDRTKSVAPDRNPSVEGRGTSGPGERAPGSGGRRGGSRKKRRKR
jgi:YidC/Oxa1 family membrane protein insertase